MARAASRSARAGRWDTESLSLIFRSLLVYALFAGIFLTPVAQQITGGFVVQMAARVLSAATSRTVEGANASGVMRLTLLPVEPVGEASLVRLDTFAHLFNVPLFCAVVVACARRRGWRMVTVLGVGTAALIVLDGIVVAGEAWELFPSAVRPPFTVAYQVLATFGVLHAVGGLFVAPTFIGALVALTLLSRNRPQHVQRNAPCPCGSGRKFKHCCG